ncbi:TM2 domain-containing membrane protein YozV [Geomicrobium halophilum]|uniref:TM2 domain-containing membrane protein YozV n=1 Tax=Geomicrobium halophilum TaxID=549000 RepID=A0A841Q071_9BACL|nr:hypothetical protein [Geomicrobium halophilum]MBB6450732.1 TM2 domain-containing membrane protein YozV [Geomicrobium halophilum]
MQNFSQTNQERRFKAYVSTLGTTQLHLCNPYIIAWWSTAFPGFGHLLLSKYLRGFALILWEILINVMARLNVGIVYSFTGQFEMVKDVLEPRWLLMYLPVYIFGIWDSYRTTVDLNKVFLLAEQENADFTTYNIGSMEINYLDKRNPMMAVLWSLATPGLGQLYIHRVLTAIFVTSLFIIFVYFSGLLVAVHQLFLGQISQATEVLHPQWLLFLPSMYGFAIYDAYVNTVENNKLFENEQRKFLKQHYRERRVKIPLGRGE